MILDTRLKKIAQVARSPADAQQQDVMTITGGRGHDAFSACTNLSITITIAK